MKRWKSWIILLMMIVICMSTFVACRPNMDEDDDWVTDSGPTQNDGNQNEDNNDGPADGNTEDGNTEDGKTEDGKTEDGKTEDGKTEDGKTEDGKTEDGNKTPTIGTGDAATDANANPLMSPSKPYNTGIMPSYDIDSLGFSKGKLSDLKGKILTFYNCSGYELFSYYNKGNKQISERTWLKELRKELGVTVKVVQGDRPGIKPFQAMNAGKDIDLISTHVSSFPYICNIMAPLENYVNMDKVNQNPGINPMMTTITKWKGNSIVLAPQGSIGALRYDATFVKNCGLEDPYDLWKKDQWNWTNFKKYMLGLPDTTKDGKKVNGCGTWGQYWYWANSNGKACFEIDGSDPNGAIINNWESAEVKETYVWLESVCDSGGTYLNGDPGNSFMSNAHKSMFTVMFFGAPGVDYVRLKEEKDPSAANDYRWVPFPKNEKNPNAVNHVELYGLGIGLPRKAASESNRQAAAKLLDLHLNRWTESRFDTLRYRSGWSQEKILEYFEFGKTNGRFGIGAGLGQFASLSTKEKFHQSITDASFSTATCMAKCNNYAKQEINNVLKFGVQ